MMLAYKGEERGLDDRGAFVELEDERHDDPWPSTPHHSVGDLMDVTLAELEGMVSRLGTIGQEMNRTIDACVKGKVDINVSSVVCLVRLGLDVHELTERIRRLSQSTRDRCAQAETLAERLHDLKG